MRVVSWNCSMGFRNEKREAIEQLEPDILILQEVAQKDLQAFSRDCGRWVGSYIHKGLGVARGDSQAISFDDEAYSPDMPWFLPLRANGINVLAVWAHKKSNALKYVRGVHRALDQYESFLSTGPAMMIGDFNSNSIWDHEHPAGQTHTDLVGRFKDIGMSSVYHALYGVDQGRERWNTYFHRRNPEQGFHIDYAFMSNALIPTTTMEIGHWSGWHTYSDHMPLIVDVTS